MDQTVPMDPTPESVTAYTDTSPVHRRIGLRALHVDDERILLSVTLGEDWMNTHGTGHGGAIATALDAGCCYAFAGRSGATWPTVSLTLNYLAPVPEGEHLVLSRVIRAGRKVGVAEAELWPGGTDVDALLAGDLDGAQPLAVACGTFHPVWLRWPRAVPADRPRGVRS